MAPTWAVPGLVFTMLPAKKEYIPECKLKEFFGHRFDRYFEPKSPFFRSQRIWVTNFFLEALFSNLTALRASRIFDYYLTAWLGFINCFDIQFDVLKYVFP